MLMGWCFYKHGILPNEFRELELTDKMIMLSAIEYFSEEEKKAMKKKK